MNDQDIYKTLATMSEVELTYYRSLQTKAARRLFIEFINQLRAL